MMLKVKFQSLIGKLQTTIRSLVEKARELEFQSLIGKLQTLIKEGIESELAGFQSLIGKLQTVSRRVE